MSRRKHEPISKIAERLLPDAAEAAHQRVEVGRQHGPQAAVAVEPEDLLGQGVAAARCPSCAGRRRETIVRRHDLDEAGAGERRAQRLLEPAQGGPARGRAQLVELRPARARRAAVSSSLKAASRAAASAKRGVGLALAARRARAAAAAAWR